MSVDDIRKLVALSDEIASLRSLSVTLRDEVEKLRNSTFRLDHYDHDVQRITKQLQEAIERQFLEAVGQAAKTVMKGWYSRVKPFTVVNRYEYDVRSSGRGYNKTVVHPEHYERCKHTTTEKLAFRVCGKTAHIGDIAGPTTYGN